MFFTAHVLSSLSSVKLKIEGQPTENLTEKLQNWNQKSF